VHGAISNDVNKLTGEIWASKYGPARYPRTIERSRLLISLNYEDERVAGVDIPSKSF